MTLLSFFSELNEKFTLYFVLPGILFLGLHLSVRLKFVQITKLSQSAKCLFSSDEDGSRQHQSLPGPFCGRCRQFGHWKYMPAWLLLLPQEGRSPGVDVGHGFPWSNYSVHQLRSRG
jgi:hypothetical protein